MSLPSLLEFGCGGEWFATSAVAFNAAMDFLILLY